MIRRYRYSAIDPDAAVDALVKPLKIVGASPCVPMVDVLVPEPADPPEDPEEEFDDPEDVDDFMLHQGWQFLMVVPPGTPTPLGLLDANGFMWALSVDTNGNLRTDPIG